MTTLSNSGGSKSDIPDRSLRSSLTVVDAIMGQGKTSMAVQLMNAEKGPWLYITPYLDEVDRIIESCPKRTFCQPDLDPETHLYKKSDHLLQLLAEGRNIASTHALFMNINDDALEMVRANGYSLIIDEVIETVQPLNIETSEREPLFSKHQLKLADDPVDHEGNVFKVLPGDDSELNDLKISVNGKICNVSTIRSWAEAGRLILSNGTILLWTLPAECFTSFRNVYNLTYMFRGSYCEAYYNMCGLHFSFKSVERGADDRYHLVDYDLAKEVPLRKRMLALINLYQGRLNAVGDHHFALSANWWKQHQGARETLVRKHLYTYFRKNVGPKPKGADHLWTCFKGNRSGLGGRGYATQHIPCNARASNQWRHKKNLGYPINRFLHPSIKRYFHNFGFSIDERQYAASELLQWIWRSRIREGKPINLYLPSSRMRSILREWANGGDVPDSKTVKFPATIAPLKAA